MSRGISPLSEVGLWVERWQAWQRPELLYYSLEWLMDIPIKLFTAQLTWKLNYKVQSVIRKEEKNKTLCTVFFLLSKLIPRHLNSVLSIFFLQNVCWPVFMLETLKSWWIWRRNNREWLWNPLYLESGEGGIIEAVEMSSSVPPRPKWKSASTKKQWKLPLFIFCLLVEVFGRIDLFGNAINQSSGASVFREERTVHKAVGGKFMNFDLFMLEY